MTTCVDVCSAVIERLVKLGLPIDTDLDDHDDVLEALERVDFVVARDK